MATIHTTTFNTGHTTWMTPPGVYDMAETQHTVCFTNITTRADATRGRLINYLRAALRSYHARLVKYHARRAKHHIKAAIKHRREAK